MPINGLPLDGEGLGAKYRLTLPFSPVEEVWDVTDPLGSEACGLGGRGQRRDLDVCGRRSEAVLRVSLGAVLQARGAWAGGQQQLARVGRDGLRHRHGS